MAVRHERVVIDLEDRFSLPMARSAAATALFRREIDSSGRSVLAFDKTTRDTAPSIDKLSGRLNLLARTAAALGPGLVPIATAAVPAIAGLATQLGFAAAGAGTAVLAFNGVGDALGALNAYQLEPTAENAAKVAEEMRGLGPAAREFVRYLDEISGRLQTVREAAQEGLLPGVQAGLDDLLTRLPQVRDIVSEIAEASGGLVAATGADLGSTRWNEFFAFLEAEAQPALETFGRTVGHLASGLAELWMAMDPLSDDFSAGLLNAAAAFERWAAALAETEGFAEFLAYVRQTGPQVLETLGSLGNALVQVGQAAAPLGGPVLAGLEAVAGVVETIADSDMGTPIMAAVAAFSALSLASRGFATVMGSSAVTGVRSLTTDLRTMGNIGVVAWGQSAAQADKYATAAGRVRSQLGGLGKSAGLVGGLAVATSGLGQSMGVTNMASMALMGTMAGPWGAAIGGAAGAAMDLAAMNDDLMGSLERTNQLLREGNISLAEQADLLRLERDAVAGFRDALEEVNLIDFEVFKNTIEGWFGASDLEEAEAALANSERLFRRNYEAIQANDRALGSLSGVLDENRDGFVTNTDAIMANVDAMRDLRSETLRGLNANLDYQAALDDSRAALKENGRTVDISTEKGRANMRALYGQAAAFNDLNDEAQNAPGAHRAAIRSFVDMAEKMGMGRREARELARDIINIPSKRIDVTVDASQAFSAVRATRAALDALRNKTVIVTTEMHTIARSPYAIARADGGSVPGQRHPYADKVLAMLAPGEEVITNRNGQADRFRADRAAGRIPHYADGGTVRGYANGGEVRQYERMYSQRHVPGYASGGTVAATPSSPDITPRLVAIERAVRALASDPVIEAQASAQGRATARALDGVAAGASRRR